MQLESLLRTLSILEEGISLRSVKAAIEYEPNAARRYVILSKLARANNLPGLFDPADGTFVNVNGQPERSVSDDIVRQLGDACLVPEIAKTNMFGLFGADEVKQDAVSKSFWCNWNIYVDEKIKRLDDLIKIITPNKFNETKKSLSNVLYETFFDLNEEEITTTTPKFAKEIQEIHNIIEELTELNSRFEKYSGKPDKKILEAIARAQAALKAAAEEDARRATTHPVITPQIRPTIRVSPNMPPEVVPGPPPPAPETETEDAKRKRRERIQELIDKAKKKKEENIPGPAPDPTPPRPAPDPTPPGPAPAVDVQPSKPINWKEIYNLNKDQIKNPDLIYPGQRLKMPNGEKDYEVKQGDSLSKIAAKKSLAESRLNSDDQILTIIKGVVY